MIWITLLPIVSLPVLFLFLRRRKASSTPVLLEQTVPISEATIEPEPIPSAPEEPVVIPTPEPSPLQLTEKRTNRVAKYWHLGTSTVSDAPLKDRHALKRSRKRDRAETKRSMREVTREVRQRALCPVNSRTRRKVAN